VTAQFQDEIDFQSVRYAITAIDGDGLFDPSDHGLHPRALSTARWRGHVCTYRVEQAALLLSGLEIGLSADEHPTAPRLFGSEPSHGPENSWHPDASFYRLAAPIDFTGRLLERPRGSARQARCAGRPSSGRGRAGGACLDRPLLLAHLRLRLAHGRVNQSVHGEGDEG